MADAEFHSQPDAPAAAPPAGAPAAPAGWVPGRKSVFVGYLLWFFLGSFGAHRFYLRRPRTALAQLLLSVVGWGSLWGGLWWAGLASAPPLEGGWAVSGGGGELIASHGSALTLGGIAPELIVGTAGGWPAAGALLLLPLWLWLLADLLLIPVMAARCNRQSAAEFGGVAPPAASAADELAKFADLRDRGAISEAEYAAQKQRLLG